MEQSQIVMYTAPWCHDCRVAKRVLEQHSIGYIEFDVDQDDEAMIQLKKLNGGYSTIPVIIFPSGTIIREPSARQFEEVLVSEGFLEIKP
jgi:mycoredoxin